MFLNTSDPEVSFDPNKLAEAFLWEKMAKQKTYMQTDVKPADLNEYVGNFELPNIGVLAITADDDKLYAKLGGQGKYQVFPLGKDEFFWKIVEARLKFGRDEKGQVSQAVIFQNGQELKGTKMEPDKIVAINAEVLDRYTGKYKMQDQVVVLSRTDNKLFAKADNDPLLELLPISDTRFIVKEINAKVTFIGGETGKAGKFKLEMNGRTEEATRVE
jgi:hypothetical protein